jgi:LacI family transcriptional regulator
VSSDANVSEFSLIGLILSDIINPNFGYLAQEIQEQAHDRNMSILVNTSYKKIKRLREILDMYRRRHVQAIIVQGGAIRDENCLRLIRECDIPIIGDHTHIQDLDDVWIDVRAGAQMAVTHLIDNFDGPIAYVSGSDEPIEATGRFKGYRDALLGSLSPKKTCPGQCSFIIS